jgi:hypothetical protein
VVVVVGDVEVGVGRPGAALHRPHRLQCRRQVGVERGGVLPVEPVLLVGDVDAEDHLPRATVDVDRLVAGGVARRRERHHRAVAEDVVLAVDDGDVVPLRAQHREVAVEVEHLLDRVRPPAVPQLLLPEDELGVRKHVHPPGVVGVEVAHQHVVELLGGVARVLEPCAGASSGRTRWRVGTPV